MPSAWITHVKKYAAENNVSYKEALSKASASYKKGSGICGSESEEPTQPTQRTRRTLTASNRNQPRQTNNTPVNNRPPRLRRGLDLEEDITEETSAQARDSSSQNFNNLNQLASRSNSLEGNGKKKRGKGKKKKNSYASRLAHCATNGLPGTN